MLYPKVRALALGTTAALLATTALAAQDAASDFHPADHAPAGVMADHMHKAGEFMIGYRYMLDYSGGTMLSGTGEVGDMELAHAGFSSTPDRMTMHMHMLDIMYAPTDWLTLMLMPQYMAMTMRMREVEGAMGHGGGHGGHAGGAHEHGTVGIGDTIFAIFAALVRLFELNGHHAHATVAISAPTGSVGERGAGGVYTHYMMQLGSGTWDFLPSLTYAGHEGPWGWGAQFGINIKLDEANDSGFRFGDKAQATVWGSREFTDWLSGSARLSYSSQDSIAGHYDGPHSHTSPPDLQGNYGGEFLEIGLGLNAVLPLGNLRGNRLGVEWLFPVHQNVRGFQQEREGLLHLVWSQAF